jgi:hypothetical protein
VNFELLTALKVSVLALTVKMEAIRASETPVSQPRSPRLARYIGPYVEKRTDFNIPYIVH